MAQTPISEQAREAEGLTRTEFIATGLAVGWIMAVGIFFWLLPPTRAPGEPFDSLRFVLILIAIFMPVAMIWVAAASARAARIMREESFRVQAAIDSMRQLHQVERFAHTEPVSEQREPTVDNAKPAPETPEPALGTPEARPDGLEPAPMPTPERPSRFSSRREISKLIVPEAAQPKPNHDQPSLALGTRPEDMDPPLERLDLIRALNFPDDENDTDGFAALRRALRDRNARKLVQASQDVLTLLSQDGIYMDDLTPEPASAGLWRRFAHGERGISMDRLGAVREKAPLMLASGRMREDTIFRDAVHHFLRRFDQMLVVFEEHATDADLLELSETRTARAFMLLGRATGIFD